MREREEGGMKRDERTKRYSAPVEGISGHYFLQYFNVKSSGFLEPSYRFLQEKPSGRSRPAERKGVCVPDGSMRGGRAARGREETAAPRGAFPAMQSLKGEPRHYAVAAVHGPLPHHPSIPPLPSLLFFSSFNSPYRSPVRPLSLFFRPARPAILLFLFHRGESFATVYTYPNGIRHSLDSEPIQ